MTQFVHSHEQDNALITLHGGFKHILGGKEPGKQSDDICHLPETCLICQISVLGIIRSEFIFQFGKPVCGFASIDVWVVPAAHDIGEAEHFMYIRAVVSQGFPKFLPKRDHFRTDFLLHSQLRAVSEGSRNGDGLPGCIAEQNLAAGTVKIFRFIFIVCMTGENGIHPFQHCKKCLLFREHGPKFPV